MSIDKETKRRRLLNELRNCRGLFVGMLSPEEAQAFEEACELKVARRSYVGGGGMMGLAKVELLTEVFA